MDIDSLAISLMDSNALIGCFKKELGRVLNIPVVCIPEVWLETELVNGVVQQEIRVSLIDSKISKEKLMELPFKAIYENVLIFEVGDFFV